MKSAGCWAIIALFVEDVVSFWTDLLRVGRTSITMHVAVEADRQGQSVQLTEAEVTYVAVDLKAEDRCPVPIWGPLMRGWQLGSAGPQTRNPNCATRTSRTFFALGIGPSPEMSTVTSAFLYVFLK